MWKNHLVKILLKTHFSKRSCILFFVSMQVFSVEKGDVLHTAWGEMKGHIKWSCLQLRLTEGKAEMLPRSAGFGSQGVRANNLFRTVHYYFIDVSPPLRHKWAWTAGLFSLNLGVYIGAQFFSMLCGSGCSWRHPSQEKKQLWKTMSQPQLWEKFVTICSNRLERRPAVL